MEPLTERPAITGARAMMSLVPGWNNLLVECMDGLHCCCPPPPRLDERPLMERGTHLRRGGGRPPEVRRPSGPKEEEFLRPPSIVVFIIFLECLLGGDIGYCCAVSLLLLDKAGILAESVGEMTRAEESEGLGGSNRRSGK